jgi:hypothetical protein
VYPLPRVARGLEKQKVVAASEVEAVPGKAKGAKRRRKASPWVGDKTSERELLLANPVKPSKKSKVKEMEALSSGLSTAKKASPTKGGLRKMPLASVEGDESGYQG